jgi:hypothetical protein
MRLLILNSNNKGKGYYMTVSDKFLLGLKQYAVAGKHDEWFFPNLRDEIIQNLSSSDAFSSIDEIVALILNAKCDEQFFGEAFELLCALVRYVDTTEIPKELDTNWDNLMRVIVDRGEYFSNQFDELRHFYRK